MTKIYIYFETLLLSTFWSFFLDIRKRLAAVGNTADWYSTNGIHFWQAQKAISTYRKQYNDALEAHLKKVESLSK